MTKVQELVRKAEERIRSYEPAEAIRCYGRGDVVFVDVRDEQEVCATGRIPGAVQASRGMLEFYIAADSPYHNAAFDADREYVFYCRSGGRSALAAVAAQEIGLTRVASLKGGFAEWTAAGGAVEAPLYLSRLRLDELVSSY